MERALFFTTLAFLISLTDLFFFWKGILRRQILPHPFTFFIWTVVLVISGIELWGKGEYFGFFSTITITLNCLGAFLVGLSRMRSIQMHMIDYFLLIAGISLIIFWRLEPHYSQVLILMIAIDATAYASSFKKAWLQPETEKSLPYFISVGTYIATIFSISVWNFETLGIWIWTALINLTFACFILARQYYMRK